MPGTNDDQIYGGGMPSGAEHAPEVGDAAAVDAAIDAVDAVVEVDAADAADVAVAEVEVVERDDAVDGEEQADSQRPSVHGRRAKPHKPKKQKDAKPAKAPKPKKPRKPGWGRRVLLGIIVAVLVAGLVLTGLFCWQKWMRYDDAADIQGVWKVQATGDTIVFDARELKITKGIAYEYRLDTQEKAISYSFGDLAGGGHYYFADDRQTLVIIDGDERLGTLAEVGFLPDDVLQADDATDNVTVLAKVSGDTTAEPSGTATGISAGATTGEREYVVKPESSSSSSSSKKKASKSSSASERDDAERGFVDEDGDGYDDETGLEYEDFLAYQAELAGEDADEAPAFVDEDEDGYDDETGLDYEDFMAEYGDGELTTETDYGGDPEYGEDADEGDWADYDAEEDE